MAKKVSVSPLFRDYERNLWFFVASDEMTASRLADLRGVMLDRDDRRRLNIKPNCDRTSVYQSAQQALDQG